MDLAAQARQMVAALPLPVAVTPRCVEALSRHGRALSPHPTALRLFLAWITAVGEMPNEQALRAGVAADCYLTAYDLLDAIYDQDDLCLARAELVPAAHTLLTLAQDLIGTLQIPAERRLIAMRALSHAGRRAFAGHLRDHHLRQTNPALASDANQLLWVARQRSGSLLAGSCAAAAALAGGNWRCVGVAARFGRCFAVAAQLEDDLDDLDEDSRTGRRTIATLVQRAWDQAGARDREVVRRTLWVLVRASLRDAGAALQRLPGSLSRQEDIWAMLPRDLRP
jgi:hypothetical protein